jgi:hypothetical protein
VKSVLFVESGKVDIGASGAAVGGWSRGGAVGRSVSERIEHLPTRRSFGVFVNLLVGSLGLVDFHAKLWQLQVGSLVTWLGESVNRFWARLPVPPQLLLHTPPTQVARRDGKSECDA